MKKRVIIVHGYTGHPDKNWFPWLKEKLASEGIAVTVPAMPHADAPQLKEWLPYLEEVVGSPDESTYLVGHSLGCITILRYLESLAEGQKIGGAVLVAGFSRPIHFTELNNFFETPVAYKKCHQATKVMTVISSDNDEHVPLEDGEIMQDKLAANFVVVANGGHLNQKSGYLEFPLVFESLMKMINQEVDHEKRT